jgi:hypothetical protein
MIVDKEKRIIWNNVSATVPVLTYADIKNMIVNLEKELIKPGMGIDYLTHVAVALAGLKDMIKHW